MTPAEIRKLAEEAAGRGMLVDISAPMGLLDRIEAALLRVQKETARESAVIMDDHEGWDANGDPIRERFGLEPER